MTHQPRTSSDVFHVAVVALPVLLLAAMVFSAAVSWRTQGSELNQTMRSVVTNGLPIDHATLIRHYDATTNKADTTTWKTILSATADLEEQFGGPFVWASEGESYDQLVRAGEPWPAGQIVHRYAEAAEPIVILLETLLDSDETIWTPLVADSVQTNLNEVQHSRAVARLLRHVFLDAIHQDNSDKAMMMIRASDRLFGPKHNSVFLVEELVQIACRGLMMDSVRQSTASDVWSDEHLAQIENLLAESQNWDQRWTSAIQSEMDSVLPILLDGKINPGLFRSGRSTIPFDLAPSTLIQVIKQRERLLEQTAPLTKRDVIRVSGLSGFEKTSSTNVAIDRLLQSPTMSGRWISDQLIPAYDSLAGAFCRAANEHRFTRTLLAVRRFEHKYDRWPESLNELTRVGLPLSEIQSLDGSQFMIKIDDEDQFTIFDQADPNTKHAFLGNKPVDQITLSRVDPN